MIYDFNIWPAIKLFILGGGFCILFAATLNINVLYECRNFYDTKSVNVFLHKTLRNKYSTAFINVLSKMMDINEKNRYDFRKYMHLK